MPVAARNKRVAYAIIAVFGGVIAYAALAFRTADDPQIIAKLRCAAKSVALHQQVFAQTEAGEPFPAFQDELEARVNRLHHFVRGLTQSNDRHSVAYRPIMIAEEADRDAAVAENAEGYVRDAWAEVQACDTLHNGDLPA
jgi:hypothetical protein